jgi:adenylosuccinate lyase
LASIKAKAAFEVSRILEIEAEVRHDVIAFLTNVNEHVGDAGRYIHVGMTSSDVLDTGLALQLKASVVLLRQELDHLADALRTLARAHKDTVMIGRSHAIHGEPITFGFKVAGWLAEVVRNQERLARLERDVSVGQVSGAMGTYANTDPEVEAITCRILGLVPDPASTQVIARDRHADYVQTLALVGAALERFSTELRNLQRTDVLEVEENFAKGQKGSSAMPHKRNPIRCERISGLARVLRSYTVAALENCALWHERDISHSSVERMMLPDCSATLHFMLREMTEVVNGLGVYPANMVRNLNVYGGVVFSQRVLLALVEAGLAREEAYRIVQRHAHAAWNTEGGDFRANLEGDPEVMARLNPDQLEACFATELHQANLGVIWDRLGI